MSDEKRKSPVALPEKDIPTIYFPRKKLYCTGCGKEIPANGYQLTEDGRHVERDDKGQAIWNGIGKIVCETCARAAMPPPPKKQRRKKGEPKYPGQEAFDVPALHIQGAPPLKKEPGYVDPGEVKRKRPSV